MNQTETCQQVISGPLLNQETNAVAEQRGRTAATAGTHKLPRRPQREACGMRGRFMVFSGFFLLGLRVIFERGRGQRRDQNKKK